VVQTARYVTHLLHGRIDQTREFVGFRGRVRGRRQTVAQGLRCESGSEELLAKMIVQLLSDAFALAGDGAEPCAFEQLALVYMV
jgi:hypothetical protein